MFAGGLAARILGLVGTLLVVRYVAPDEYGEALVAAIVIGTASTFSSIGIGQFVIVKAGGRRDLAFHATAYQFLLGLVALGLVLVLQRPIAAWSHAPGVGRYLPVLAVSMLLDRLWFVPERTLMRDLRFRTVTLVRSAGELAYTAVSVAGALLGWGGMAIAAGNVARSAVKAAMVLRAVDRREWLQPCRLRRDATAALLRFGLPLAVGTIAGYAAGRWDNLLVSSFYGPAVMAAYSIAYNLAGMAAGLVVEQVVDVLVPSFARADARGRADGLLRGAALLAVVTTPLCFGLAAVSPTLVSTFFEPRWAAVAPMLAALSVAAILGPTVGLILAYLQAVDRARLAMVVQLVALVAVLGAVATLGRLGPLWTCAAVGVGALLCVLSGAVAVQVVSGIPAHRLLSTQLGPILASGPMVAAVLATRWGLARAAVDVRYGNLALEVAVGAVFYGGAALLLARSAATDLLGLAQAAFLRRRAPPPASPEPDLGL
jgi:PST family polysaccharide transporter